MTLHNLNNLQRNEPFCIDIVMYASNTKRFNDLVHLSEALIQSMQELDMDELKVKVTEYTQKMENHFLTLKSQKPLEQSLEEFKQLLLLHEKVTGYFLKEKQSLSRKLKSLHAGKAMQNTYSEK